MGDETLLEDIAGDIQVAQHDGEMWAFILTHLPFVRNKRLWDDVTAEMEEVYRTGTPEQTAAAMEYATIRFRFFEHLEVNHRNLRHVNTLEMAQAQSWYMRLADRLGAMEPGRVNKRGRWVPPKVPKKVHHPLMH